MNLFSQFGAQAQGAKSNNFDYYSQVKNQLNEHRKFSSLLTSLFGGGSSGSYGNYGGLLNLNHNDNYYLLQNDFGSSMEARELLLDEYKMAAWGNNTELADKLFDTNLMFSNYQGSLTEDLGPARNKYFKFF